MSIATPEKIKLTKRQIEVAYLLSEDKQIGEIAAIMKISIRTVQNYIFELRIYSKSDNLIMLINWAKQNKGKLVPKSGGMRTPEQRRRDEHEWADGIRRRMGLYPYNNNEE